MHIGQLNANLERGWSLTKEEVERLCGCVKYLSNRNDVQVSPKDVAAVHKMIKPIQRMYTTVTALYD